MEIKRHKKIRPKRWGAKYIPSHHEGSCPYCHAHVKSVEAHIDEKHENEKPRRIKGILHGNEQLLV